MYDYYDVKPYHFFAVDYSGGSTFFLEIFNMYGLEIDYPLEARAHRFSLKYMGGWVNDVYHLGSDFEIDKLCAQFSYNCYTSGTGEYDLVISKSHLKRRVYYKVFSRNACTQRSLNDSMKWVEIGYKNLFWKIKIKWRDGTLLLHWKWYDFAKAGKLCCGDICVFQKTSHSQKFEVSVFEKRNVNKFNKADGLKKLFLKYSVHENYVMVFDNVGPSHFYVSIYNNNSVDIFHEFIGKFLLEDVIREPKCPIVVLSDDSEGEFGGA
ncbi:hypothetical protein POM88_049763 [Heracleum sosnowskyi]|uniref:TF-B3 domain-containing protein n=1 Tax=Heracleum sosnowskyi TaxID=360622 RepID=A0AAD8M1V4_9APIA|nr:hypothetical protein POM88_049763 [Heracleum sosnowskyi]